MQWHLVGVVAVGIVVLAALVGVVRYRRLSPLVCYVALLAFFTAARELTSQLLIVGQ